MPFKSYKRIMQLSDKQSTETYISHMKYCNILQKFINISYHSNSCFINPGLLHMHSVIVVFSLFCKASDSP